ncbi:MAG: hypothetical protein K6F28_10155 [Lachnospiraceae bacterium]|nr:hypothetical protein [Lachnospiraceae bacterium]
MMKKIYFGEFENVNGGWPNGWDVAQEKKPVGWPNGWDVAEKGPLASCDPPYKGRPFETCDPPCMIRAIG